MKFGNQKISFSATISYHLSTGRRGGMDEKKMFHPEQYAIVVPYQDFLRLMEAASKMEKMEYQIKRIDERTAAMQLLYSQILEKVAELNRKIS